MPSSGSDGQQWLLYISTSLLFVPGVWNGFACLSNPCVHGVCLDDLNSTYFCYCIDGYTGIECQTNWNECWSSPCQNGGICIDGIAKFNCSCPPGYVGDLCEEDFNECESNPCWNNGTCVDAPNGYDCNCLPGYSGVLCEIDVAVCNATNETRCSNGGICEEGPGEKFSCKCQPGWGGFLCEREIDECMSAPCLNGAICIDLHADYACSCLFGYTGHNCEEVVQICDENPCKNGALCLIEEHHSVCYCVPDFHGDLCQFQYDECQLGPRCMNGGSCIDGIDNFTCSCPPNLTGVLCECLILDDNTLDCTYIRPTSAGVTFTTPFEDLTTETTYRTVVTSFPTIKTTFETKTVPNITTEIPIISPETTPCYMNTTLDTTVTPFSTSSTFMTETSLSSISIEPRASTETTLFTTESTIITVPSSTESITVTSIETSPTISSSTEPILTTQNATTPFVTYSSSTEASTTISIEITPEHPVVSTTTEIVEPLTTTTEITVFTFPSSTTEITESTTSSIAFTIPPEMPFSLALTPLVTGSSTTEQLQDNFTEGSSEEPVSWSTLSTFLTEEPKTAESTFLTTVSSTTFIPTEEATNITTIEFDCTISETSCKNGGTCIYADQGYKCVCPFDTEGPNCEIQLGIRKVAFTGDSYLSHRLLNFSHIAIEFEAKTLASSGLLFYASIDSSYMALYLEGGYLKFKFSCGYQTMLLSELKVPVNNGNTMKIKAELDFRNDFTHCDASLRLNHTLAMTGDQVARINKFVNPTAWLHLGGIPQVFFNENVPVNGFVGCMSDLKISNRKVNIFKDAEDGSEVSECASLACLSSPCANGGSCSSKGEDWQCSCRNGYVGKMCETSVCNNNPCLFGGTCIPFSGSGYICLCPYGKHGHFCENDLKITDPHFSSTVRGLSSYVAYPIPNGISKGMELKFKFTPTTMEQISLLLFIGQGGQHDFYSDHLAVSFVKGYIMLTWNLGSGPRRIFTSQPIKKGARDYMVRLGHVGRRAWLHVENLGNVTGRSPGNLVQLDVVPMIFLGGHDSSNFSNLPHDLPLHSGFSGCIFDVELKSGSVVIPLQGSRQATGRAVGQCGTTECFDQSCQNGGACLHHGSTFMCLCQDLWFGPLCSSKNNLCDATINRCSAGSTCVPLISDYECDCPFGRSGKYCEIADDITDVSLTGKRSYIKLQPVDFESNRFNIEMQIRILNDDGLIFFMGRKGSSFISLALQSGLLELRIQSTRSKMTAEIPLTITSTKLLVKGIWYKVQFGLFGRKAYLSVENIINTGLINAGTSIGVSNEPIFIGGLHDMSLLPLSSTSSLPVPYAGCVRQLSVDNSHIPLSDGNIEEARNVVDCDGTPCGGDFCENGGTCWLDSFMKPHCSCVPPYYGNKCEHIPGCNEKACQNLGTCVNSHCLCKIGWHGASCENEITVTTPKFTGKSYLIVKKNGDKKRDVRALEVQKLYLNFTTAKPDGLLLWSRKDKNCVGLGLSNGFLKLTYSYGRPNKNIIEVPSSVQLSDGLWHTIEIMFTPFSLQLDKKPLHISTKHDKIMSNTSILTNGVFYIGGLPTKSNLLKETNGMFNTAFEGCIESFGANAEKPLTNFTNVDGTNVGVCDII